MKITSEQLAKILYEEFSKDLIGETLIHICSCSYLNAWTVQIQTMTLLETQQHYAASLTES